jgi:glyoxylase-like metal-dependent hydrolase (beta-lactamase superfamily II)
MDGKLTRSPGILRRLCAAIGGSLVALPALAATPMLPEGKVVGIADGVHVIPDEGVALVPNVGIVVGDDGVLVIDTGMGPANAEIVLAAVRGLTRLPIRYLVTTHFHPEHNYGAQAFPDETLLVYATAQHEDLQRKGEAYRTWFIEMFGDDVRELLEPVELREPDLTFEKHVELNLGGKRAELYYFGQPAHTGGDTVVYLPQQKVAFVGDLVPNGRFPILADEDSSIHGWIRTLDALAALGAETIIPSHGPPGKAGLIRQVRDYLTSIETGAERLRSDGVALEAAQDTLLQQFTERYPDWSEPNWIRNAVERAYAEAAAR